MLHELLINTQLTENFVSGNWHFTSVNAREEKSFLLSKNQYLQFFISSSSDKVSNLEGNICSRATVVRNSCSEQSSSNFTKRWMSLNVFRTAIAENFQSCLWIV